MGSEFLPSLRIFCVLLRCQALHTVVGQQTEQNQLVNGADASRIRWCRMVNVINATIEIGSLEFRGPKTFYVRNGIASRDLNFQYIVNCQIF